MAKRIFNLRNQLQADSNQTCFNCRGAKEEKTAKAGLTKAAAVVCFSATTLFASGETPEDDNGCMCMQQNLHTDGNLFPCARSICRMRTEILPHAHATEQPVKTNS